MSNKGERKKSKTLNVPKSVRIGRKETVWTVRTKAGAHKKNVSVPLGIVLRNYIGLAKTMNEAKKILTNGDVKVNGKIRKEHQFGVGLFDVISIEKQEISYRAVLDRQGRISLNELKNVSTEKLCKVEKKIMTSKGIQITTNDGLTFTQVKANVGDTLKIKFPENKVESVIEMKKGALIYITKGHLCSQKGIVEEVNLGTAKRKKLVKISQGKTVFETIAENVFVIGEGTEALGDLKI